MSAIDNSSQTAIRRQVPSPGRRLAAAGALLALGAAIALVVATFLRDPVRLSTGLLMVFLAVLAGWVALVHRGVWRLAALVVVAAALIVIGLVLAAGSPLRLAALVVLVGLAITAGRVALGQDLAVQSGRARVVRPAKRGVLLMNPRSGGGKVERFHLVDEARRRGVTPIVPRPGDDLRALAERALADGADVIGMAGGDGSQALVADVARRHGTPFVVVPAGTRNHFALDLGLDREDVVGALDAFSDAMECPVDLAVLGDRVFVNNASLGVYATIVQSDDYRDAKMSTAAKMAPELLGPDAEPADLRYQGPNGRVAAPAAVVLVSNGPYRLDRLTGFGTRARLDSGVLGIVTVTVERARDVPTLLAAEAAGQLHRFSGYRQWTATEFEVDSAKPLVDVGVDGEALRLPPPLRFRSLPGALRVRTPMRAGFSPAALAPAGPAEAVTGVVRVLVGRSAR